MTRDSRTTSCPTQTECIRELTAGDARAVSELARVAFPATQSRFVYPGNTGIVATVEGRVVAACLVRVLRLPCGGRVGFVAWLMTHPDFRGRGLARKLVEAATRDLKAAGCETVVTDIEGYNTASANTFLRSGYGRISFGQQLRRWNAVDLLWIWIRTGLVLDPGHFLWVTDPEAPKPHPVRGWFFSVGLNTLLALTAFSLGGGVFLSGTRSVPSIPDALAFLLALGALFLAHGAGLSLLACRAKQPLVYRPWSGGWGMSFLIALCFGSTFPLPGNVYPPDDGWDQRRFLRLFGQGALLSTLLLAALVLLGGWLRSQTLHPFSDAFALALLNVGKPLLVFNTLIAVAPFEGFHGRHLRDFNSWIWLLMSLLAVLMFVWA